MLKVYKYPEVPDQDQPNSGELLFGIQDGKSITPLPFFTNGNNSAIVSFTAVEFDQFRNEINRISLDTSIIDIDTTNNIYNVDSLTDYVSVLENGVYRFEFQNDSNLWQTEYFKVTDFTLDTLTFKFSIDTSLGVDNTFTLPLPIGQTYNFIVNYGDGSNDKTVLAHNDANATYDYGVPFVGEVTVFGKCGGWSFNNLGDKLKITSIDQGGDVQLDSISGGFHGCSNLASLPIGTGIKGTSSLMTIDNLFNLCTSLSTIPLGIFDLLIYLSEAEATFQQSAITTLPIDIFRQNILINTFRALCNGATSMISIPVDLFRYNVLVTRFDNVFTNTRIIIIPVDTFRYNVLVTLFDECFYLDSALTTIPNDLFRYNIAATSMKRSFGFCIAVTSLPENLYFYNILVTNYFEALTSLRNIVLPSVIFDLTAISIVTDFRNYMLAQNTGFSHTGSTQDIWTPAAAALHTNTFLNQTALTNYASIDVGWK